MNIEGRLKEVILDLEGSVVEQRLSRQQIVIPKPPEVRSNFIPCIQVEKLIYLSGQGPVREGIPMFQGIVGRELDKEQGYEAARQCGLNLLAQLRAYIEQLDRIRRIVQLKGYVVCTEEFAEIPYVVNGASDLMTEVFGEKGRHTRCALGMKALPNRIPVEIEMIAEVY